jgi:hypothetical protein
LLITGVYYYLLILRSITVQNTHNSYRINVLHSRSEYIVSASALFTDAWKEPFDPYNSSRWNFDQLSSGLLLIGHYRNYYLLILKPTTVKNTHNSYRINVYRFRAFWLNKSTVTCLFLSVHNSMNFCVASVNNMADADGKLR